MSTTSKQLEHQRDDFIPTEQLIRQQDVRPMASPDDVAAEDPFGSDDEHADFLADLSASRRSSIC